MQLTLVNCKFIVCIMPKMKKWLKLLAYSLLIVLALVGIGVTGVPVPPPNKKEDQIIEINVERVDEKIDEIKSIENQKKN